MRHQVHGRHLSRTSAHRAALRRNLAASLFEHGTITTTREKAKFVKPFAEKLITMAKKGSLHERRRAIALLQNRDICRLEDGEPIKETTVITRLFSEIAPRFAQRNGGYTRIVALPLRRIGDNGQLVMLQLVGELQATEKTATPAKHLDTPADQSSPDAPAPQPQSAPQSPKDQSLSSPSDQPQE